MHKQKLESRSSSGTSPTAPRLAGGKPVGCPSATDRWGALAAAIVDNRRKRSHFPTRDQRLDDALATGCPPRRPAANCRCAFALRPPGRSCQQKVASRLYCYYT
jgi:hypothetical protein